MNSIPRWFVPTLIILASIPPAPSIALAQGVQLRIVTFGRTEKSGELLSVRERSLVLRSFAFKPGNNSAETLVVAMDSVRQLVVSGDLKILDDAAKGFLDGAFVGLAIALILAPGSGAPFGAIALISCTVFGAAGAVIGLIAGVVDSSPDRTITPLPGNDYALLRPHARYPLEEPPELQRFR